MNNSIESLFIPSEITGKEPAWCVDGRKDLDNHHPGPHMLGASLHPIVISALYQNLPVQEDFVCSSTQKLREEAFGIGVHRGSHYDKDKCRSDCGFADNLPTILQKTRDARGKIVAILTSIYQNNKNVLPDISADQFKESISSVYLHLDEYDIEGVTCIGDSLITLEEKQEHADVEHLEGDHGEECVFINVKPQTTLDTNALNNQGNQAFNLDLWSAVEQSKVLGVPSEFATVTSLILYVATEMVLVEDKGKEALPVVVHG